MTVSIPVPSTRDTSPARRAVLRIARLQATPVIMATVVLFLFAAVVAPRSLSPASLVAILVPAGITAVAAIGQTLVIQQKGIDLSVGGIMTLAAVSSGMMSTSGVPFLVSLGIVAVISILAGMLNGFLVIGLHITPLLATLASNSIFIGAVWTISSGTAKLAPPELREFASKSTFGLPTIAWLALILVIVVAVVMSRSVLGRRYTASGSSPAAALAGGVNVPGLVLLGYVMSGVFGGVAGLLLAGYAGQTTYDLGVNYMLPVIAAVVIGGANLSGGRGSVIATAFGCLILSLVVQMVLTLGAPTSTQLLVQSAVLALAASVKLLPWEPAYLALVRALRRSSRSS
jgi:ribose transport system permease protein